MDALEIKNHYGKYSKKELHRLIMELYNDNVKLIGQLKTSVREFDNIMIRNIELLEEIEKLKN